MLLYHGTISERLVQIETDGEIRPRGAGRSNWRIPSHPRAVYLTDAYAGHFAINAVTTEMLRHPGVTLALIEIDTDALTGLVPDEDWLEQSTRTKRNTKQRMRERTAACRAKLHTFLGDACWRDSINGMGTCAHLGPVPWSAVTRVALIDLATAGRWGLAVMDALPGIKPYQLCGDIHRQLTADAFSGALAASTVRVLQPERIAA